MVIVSTMLTGRAMLCGLFTGRKPVLLSFGDGLAKEEFNLAVDAAQVVCGPFPEFFPEIGRDAEEEGFAFRHGHSAQA